MKHKSEISYYLKHLYPYIFRCGKRFFRFHIVRFAESFIYFTQLMYSHKYKKKLVPE